MKKSWLFKAFGFVVAFVSLDILYDTTHFVVKRYELNSTKIKSPYHFVVLSDLHDKAFGHQNKKLLAAIDKIKPEAVYIAGDMITALPGRQFDDTIAFLKSLSEKYPVYYGSGNHEYRMRINTEKYGNMSSEYEEKIRNMGIVRLYTGSTVSHRKDVKVYGLEIDRMYYRKWKMPKMPVDYTLQKNGKAEQDCFTILLAHNPEFFDNYAKSGVDLVLSGHVHGGVARIPFFGGVISPKFRLFPKYDGGLFVKNKTTMILSRGLGCHTIPVRFLNPGELIEVFVSPEADK